MMLLCTFCLQPTCLAVAPADIWRGMDAAPEQYTFTVTSSKTCMTTLT